MAAQPRDRTTWNSLVYRSVWLPAAVAAALLLMTLLLLVVTSWNSQTRLEPVQNHLREISRLQQTGLLLQATLVDTLNGIPLSPHDVSRLRARMTDVISIDSHLVPQTPQRLLQAQLALVGLASQPRNALIAALLPIRQVIGAEIEAHDLLLAEVQQDSRIEFRIAALAMIVVPLLGALLIYLLRNRIVMPLKTLGSFMALLADQQYRMVPTEGVDPMLASLFEHYNGMVKRLEEFERQYKSRQLSLENEVRTATRTLLEHQRELTNAERLAAVGEVAAGLAHELRNPMAGIQMALSNLRRDLTDSEQVARLDLVIGELKRVTRLLNDLLDQSHQAPEPIVDVHLAEKIKALLDLVRYQIAENIQLKQCVADDLCCRLPEGRMRQALLNLIVNAAQSIGNHPGTITVAATLSDTVLRIQVRDDGPGFPEPLLTTGVRSFTTWRDGGTGLGLAMVRRFALDLGGTLNLANQCPQGACVTLELPCGTCDD